MSGQSSNDALNRTVLRSSRNVFKDETVLMLDGREFQAHAAATGKARSPIVDQQVDSTVSAGQLPRKTHAGSMPSINGVSICFSASSGITSSPTMKLDA